MAQDSPRGDETNAAEPTADPAAPSEHAGGTEQPHPPEPADPIESTGRVEHPSWPVGAAGHPAPGGGPTAGSGAPNPWARPGTPAAAGGGASGYDPPTNPGLTPAAWTPGAGYAPGAGGPTSGFTAQPGHPGGPYPGPYAGYAPGGPQTGPAGPFYPPGSVPGRRSPGGPNRTLVLVLVGVLIAVIAGGIGGVVGASASGSRISGSATDGGELDGPLPPADGDQTVTPVEQVARKVLPSVVQFRVEGGTLASDVQVGGSGMIVSQDGLMLTNNHVVEPAAGGGTVRALLQDGRTVPVRIIGRDPESDVAVVKADNVAGLPTIELGNSDGVRVGQEVIAFGSPLGLGGSVTGGIVSAINRAVSVGPESGSPTPIVLSALQTDAAINPGNSGGPLVDMQGRVIGINSVIATAGPGGGSIGVGFAIPMNQAKRIADQLRTTGRATHATLGVGLTEDPEQNGVRVSSVLPGGPAERGGLRPGDLVVRFDDQRVTTVDDLQAAVRSQAPGATVDLQLADRTARVTLGVE